MKTRWTAIKPKVALSESSLFRFVVRLFAYPALFFAVLSIGTTKIPSHPIAAPEMLNLMFSTLAQPVIMAGLALPLLGLIASHLRSVQAKEQIENQQKQIETQQTQNKFSNYLAHRDQFNSFFNEDQPLGGLSDISKWQIYGRLFPGAQEADFRVHKSLLDLFKDIPGRLETICRELYNTKHNNLSKNQEIVKQLRPIESDIERFTDFHFSEFEEPMHPVSRIQKSLERQKRLLTSLYDCSNFHREEIEIHDKWFCEKSYEDCIEIANDLAFQEKIYGLWARINYSSISGKAIPKELLENLRGITRHEAIIREDHFEKETVENLVRQVLLSNFREDRHESLIRLLPPELQIALGFTEETEQTSKPESNGPEPDENSA